MKAHWLIAQLVPASLVFVMACTSSVNNNQPPPNKKDPITDPHAPCTDPRTCCPPEDMVCEGDGPDGQTICTCEGLWDCSLDPNKCEQDAPVPSGGADWDCQWTEFVYRCTADGSESNPPGGGGWDCTWVSKENQWRCDKDSPPNPSNKPAGSHVWNCVYDKELKKLICDRGGSSTPPKGEGDWDCKKKEGKDVCDKKDDNGGLPTGGGNWRCNRVAKGGKMIWVCYGEVPKGDKPPGGGEWDCEKVKTEGNKDIYKCVKEDNDQPPGGGHYACAKGSEFNGTRCVKTDKPPSPPPQYPKPGDTCVPGAMHWCDGLQYCGWGQVTCKPDGSWPTRVVDGKTVLDCQERQDGRRPNTACACYHFYYNAACCERPDCMIEPGQQGQICPDSAGQLCDYCNPQSPECKGQGALCIVTAAMETFCGQACATDSQCPKDYKCVKISGKPDKQCIPSDFSCYY
jgi:hypothetical protein